MLGGQNPLQLAVSVVWRLHLLVLIILLRLLAWGGFREALPNTRRPGTLRLSTHLCGEAGLFYGPEDQYVGINGAKTPSDCADSGVPSYIPVLVSTAVLVR
eukprot:m.261402 g.261402  ORF g.261402 m.261402 type:complete len:101 (+) comp17598_c0_seq3:1135-1437(+)